MLLSTLSRTKTGTSAAHAPSWPAWGPEPQNPSSRSPPSKASKPSCTQPLFKGKQILKQIAKSCHRIDDRKTGKPRMRGFLHGSSVIFREKGYRGFFQGLVPTTARQAANSATRFGSYTTMKQIAQSYVAPGGKLGPVATFGIGATAGLITV